MASRMMTRIWASRERVDKIARQSPARLALFVFAAVIMVFTALLSLPAATASGQRAPLIDALFTATSAVCVTGLTIVPTGVYWSTFGQAVILLGIKVGGLGVMTLASILGLAVTRRLGLTARLLTASETKTTRLGEVGSLIRVVIITSTSLELIIALLLVPRFIYLNDSVGNAIWHSAFYAISAFNNAGFVPTAEGLAPHFGDWMLLVPIMLGMFIGSLGFPVILNIARQRKRFTRWSLHAKLTVVTSALLVGVGFVWFLVVEWMNPYTLGPMAWQDKLLSSSFLMLAILAEARGDKDIDTFGRRIPRDSLRQAVAVTFVGATIILVSCLILLEITGFTLDVVLFEAISAFATVGLSTGITPIIPTAGQYVLVALMFVGRVGTMTLGAALALRSRRRVIRLPEERPIIG